MNCIIADKEYFRIILFFYIFYYYARSHCLYYVISQIWEESHKPKRWFSYFMTCKCATGLTDIASSNAYNRPTVRLLPTTLIRLPDSLCRIPYFIWHPLRPVQLYHTDNFIAYFKRCTTFLRLTHPLPPTPPLYPHPLDDRVVCIWASCRYI